jgi:hypothetical protein
MDSRCPHRQDPDQCLICWAEWNVDLEKIRVEAGLSRVEFLKAVRECVGKHQLN